MIEILPEQLKTAERIRSPLGVGYFPVMIVANDGAIVAVYRAGGGHGGRKGYLVASRSEDAGHTWADPVVVVQTLQYDDRNPAIGVANNGTITVSYHANAHYGADDLSIEERRNPGALHTGLVHSFDHGRTWSEPMIWTDTTPWDSWSPYGSIITTSNGTMAMPIYWDESYLLRSSDNGWTWGDLTFVSKKINEAAFLPLPGTNELEWICLGRRERRDNDDEAAMLRLRSTDGGRTWDEDGLFIPGLRYPPDMAVLSDDSILVAYGYRDQPEGARATRLFDDGRRWSETELVVHDTAPNFDTGYASVVIHDGWVVIAFYDADGGDVYEYEKAFCEVVRVREEEILEVLV
jgi:hypothetical protein